MFVYEQWVGDGSLFNCVGLVDQIQVFRRGNTKHLYQLSWLTDSNFYFFLCHKLDYKANVTFNSS